MNEHVKTLKHIVFYQPANEVLHIICGRRIQIPQQVSGVLEIGKSIEVATIRIDNQKRAAGTIGYVPAPASGDTESLLCSDGRWKTAYTGYSTSEKKTGLVWIDGGDIYEKTYALSSEIEIPNAGVAMSSYIDNYADIETFIDAKGINDSSGSYGTQVGSLWFGYYQGSLKAYCSEGIVANNIVLRYTKAPSSADKMFAESGVDPRSYGNITASQQGYVMSDWRSAYTVFANKSKATSASYMYSTYETADRIDGCDWVEYQEVERGKFKPYCVEILAGNDWGGTYPTVYLEFSDGGSTYDTLWTGIPSMTSGHDARIRFNATKYYDRFRIRLNNGTGYSGYEWCGCLPFIQVYATWES